MDESLWTHIRLLHHHEKVSAREIARQLDVDRDTVRRALKSERCPRRECSRRGSILDPYVGALEGILEEYPKLSGVRILEKLRELGYPGQMTILRDKLGQLRPRKNKEAFVKRESLPGAEAQVDWGSCGHILVDGTVRPLSVFVMVLSYSRLMYVEFTVSQEMEDFLRGHVNGFRSFKERCPKIIVYDNLKSVVQWRHKRLMRFNGRFMEFAGTYLFKPQPCNVRRGNEKPRAETGVRYVKQNFLAGREFRDFTDLRTQAFHWLRDVANVRIHGTTRERPIDRFEQEERLLQHAPPDRYDTRIVRTIGVSHQARIKFQTNTYTVPPEFVGRALTLKASPDSVWIYDGDQEVATHNRSYGKHRDIENPEHTKAILATKPKARIDKDRDAFLGLGTLAHQFLKGFLDRGQGSPDFHIDKLLYLVEEHGATPVLGAMERAIEFGAFGADSVQNILQQRIDGRSQPPRRPLELPTRPDLEQYTTEAPNFEDYHPFGELEKK